MSRNIKTRLVALEAKAASRQPARNSKEAAIAVLHRTLMAACPPPDGFLNTIPALGERLEAGTTTPEDDAILASLPAEALQSADMTAAGFVIMYRDLLQRI